MTGNLGDHLAARLASSTVDPATGALAWAAFSGEADLQSALGGEAATADVASEPTPTNPVVGTYIRSITVEGFRGIGPLARPAEEITGWLDDVGALTEMLDAAGPS